MSNRLVEYVNRFLRGEIPLAVFIDGYIDGWRAERDSEKLLADDSDTSEALSSIFCVVDLYNPDENREAYELNEAQLRYELQNLVEGVGKFTEIVIVILRFLRQNNDIQRLQA